MQLPMTSCKHWKYKPTVVEPTSKFAGMEVIQCWSRKLTGKIAAMFSTVEEFAMSTSLKIVWFLANWAHCTKYGYWKSIGGNTVFSVHIVRLASAYLAIAAETRIADLKKMYKFSKSTPRFIGTKKQGWKLTWICKGSRKLQPLTLAAMDVALVRASAAVVALPSGLALLKITYMSAIALRGLLPRAIVWTNTLMTAFRSAIESVNAHAELQSHDLMHEMMAGLFSLFLWWTRHSLDLIPALYAAEVDFHSYHRDDISG